jgi:hypothetical protein
VGYIPTITGGDKTMKVSDILRVKGQQRRYFVYHRSDGANCGIEAVNIDG